MKTVVIDLWSVVPDIPTSPRTVGTPVPGLADYVRAEQASGSSVFFIAGGAYNPQTRQRIENFLESIGIRGVFVSHGIPDGFDIFISSKAFHFRGGFPSV